MASSAGPPADPAEGETDAFRAEGSRNDEGAVYHSDGAVYCLPCQQWCNGPSQFDDHKKGKKHKVKCGGTPRSKLSLLYGRPLSDSQWAWAKERLRELQDEGRLLEQVAAELRETQFQQLAEELRREDAVSRS